MADVVLTGLTWNPKVLLIEAQKWPFIQLNIAYSDETILNNNITFDFSEIYTSSSQAEQFYSGAITSCVYSGKDIPLGNDAYYGSGDVTLHRKVGSNHAGTLLHFDGHDYGFFYDGPVSDIWTNSVNYQFIVYDTKSNKYYVPSSGYMLVSRWSNPDYMGVSNYEGNPFVMVSPGDKSPTAFLKVNFTYIPEISAVLETAKGDTTDPYEKGGGESGPGGGTGNFDGAGDDIDIPGLPTLSAVDTGFITLFNPSAGELRNLANYMWGDLFDLDTFKKLFADPMDCILGLSIVPVAVPNGGSKAVSVGNISTGVSMTLAGSQYVEVDCGTLNVNEYWGAYLDYDPFTKAEIYLPYIGTHPLAVDDIMNKSVHVVYHIDILSGACCAYVKCGGSVLYSFVGQCSCSIPITGKDWTNVVNGALSIAASIGTMVATGGASAPLAASAIASTAVNSMKPNVEKSGSMGGMGGMLGVQTPYLILTRPRQAVPAEQNRFTGYPSFITRKLSDISGYTEIESIHLDGIPATEQELSELEILLKGGVIL